MSNTNNRKAKREPHGKGTKKRSAQQRERTLERDNRSLEKAEEKALSQNGTSKVKTKKEDTSSRKVEGERRKQKMRKTTFGKNEVMYAAEDDECFLPSGNNGQNNIRREKTRKERALDQKELNRYANGKDTSLLKDTSDPEQVKEDIRLINRGTRSRWNVNRKRLIKRRLERIVQFGDEDIATSAAKALIAMNGQDQRDDLAELERNTPKNGINVNVNTHVNGEGSRVLQFVDRLRTAGIDVEIPIQSEAGNNQSPVRTGDVQARPGESVLRFPTLEQTEVVPESESH